MAEAPQFRSKTQLLLRETWRRAFHRAQEGGHLRIVFKAESHAHKARMDLYKAVQAEKQGKGMDLELIEASQNVEIVLAPGERNVLIMRHRSQSDIYSALQEATGLQLETMVDPELARGAEDSLKELEKLGYSPSANVLPESELPQLSAEHKPNPFFDRSKK